MFLGITYRPKWSMWMKRTFYGVIRSSGQQLCKEEWGHNMLTDLDEKRRLLDLEDWVLKIA